MYQNLVNVVASPIHLRSLEHRHMIQYVKQFIEYILLSCPSTLYQSHLSPILAPFFEHIEQRLNCTWAPIQGVGSLSIDVAKPLTTNDCKRAAELASQGGDNWYMMYYARGGLFVGDLDPLTSDAVHEKVRVELSRCFCDMLQSALALKGDWALVLANQARLEQALKSNDASKLLTAPSTKVGYNKSSGNCLVNADGSPRSTYHEAIEARKNLRIKSVCHYLLLEDERIAGYLVLTIIQCLAYPDAYTCRRSVKICHRILETTAWVDRYTQL
jgi:exportin-5